MPGTMISIENTMAKQTNNFMKASVTALREHGENGGRDSSMTGERKHIMADQKLRSYSDAGGSEGC